MAVAYGFKSLSIRALDKNRQPSTTAPIHVIKGDPEKGAPVTMELTGLTKEAVKVFGGNIEYFVVRKGVGAVAANFGLLDLPTKIEQEIYGYEIVKEGIDGIGNNTEAPFVAAFCESEDMKGEPVAYAILAGTLTTDGFSIATKTDEDFTPEPGETVMSAVSRKVTVETEEKEFHVMRAFGSASVEELRTIVLGAPLTGGE
ncbi:phage tail protein [Enterococcus alcedinis]|uniref:Phage tail protein n=1 Tax=Enterococcus alcedinis TaxID=1274384 RepID=A0A917N3P6_9ENTE|nr:phage tail protein [Enterococcus alcedinis]MBP2100961.1 hypothetical protein [Enterococcus alcedinis]GGI64743.1 hypothetical protein GCM10011482_03970 [Enterococcus alcedinis]